MGNFSNIAYAEVNLKYDKELFAQEYDKEILTRSSPFINIFDQWNSIRNLNKFWNVLPNEKFLEYDELNKQGQRQIDNVTHQWDMINLMQIKDGNPLDGGAYWRNSSRNLDKVINEEFKNLEIVKWIQQNIPAKRLVGIHCVSMEPGVFTTIHRDLHWPGPGPNPGSANGFFKEGFLVLCLNISSGGSPLRWSLDHEIKTPRSADADCYIVSDYFLHAVPLVTSRRRQVRISFLPDDSLASLINYDTAVIVPDDYQYLV